MFGLFPTSVNKKKRENEQPKQLKGSKSCGEEQRETSSRSS